jgi:SAM-dependent methyltransferase
MGLTARHFFSLDAAACDPHVESEFFAGLRMRNGTFKLTRPSRFAELDEAFSSVIAERATQLRSVLDVGASSGITTIDLAEFLRRQGVSATITATDLFVRAHLIDAGPTARILTDADGWPLQYDIGGVAVRPWISRLDYLTLACIPRLVARRLVQRRAKAVIERGESRVVALVSPRLARRDDVEMVEDDVMQRTQSFARRFDLVRAANVLNRNYFPTRHLERAIDNIRSYLRGPGALFLVARTNRERENAGTLFELDQSRTFRAIARVGGGSEIEALVAGRTSDIREA